MAVCVYNASSGRTEGAHQPTSQNYELLVQRTRLKAITAELLAYMYTRRKFNTSESKQQRQYISQGPVLVSQACNPNIWAVEAQVLGHGFL